MTKRKIIIIIGLIILALLVIWGIAFLTTPKSTQTSQNTGTNFFSNIFPFFKTSNKPNNSLLDMFGLGGDNNNTNSQESLLRKVSSFPVSGYGIINKERFIDVPEVTPQPQVIEANTATTTPSVSAPIAPVTPPTEFVPAVKYIEKTSGNVYQTYADKIDERKLSSDIIPIIHEAFFGRNGQSVVMRYLQGNNTIATFIKALPVETLGADISGSSSNSGIFLPENITDVSISPDASQMFYLLNIQNSSVGITANQFGENKTQVFSSPFTEWLSQWPNDRMITLTTKPSYKVPGYMYAVDPTKKDFTKIIDGINGLTTLTSPNGRMVLYSNNNLSMFLYDTSTGNTSQVGLRTLPEKCAWNKNSDKVYCAVPRNIPSGQYPDSWYMGETSFTDDLWSLDVLAGNTQQILDTSGGEALDMIKIGIDDKENYLFFINKIDSYLWEFDL